MLLRLARAEVTGQPVFVAACHCIASLGSSY
jgi:hypothetical protein